MDKHLFTYCAFTAHFSLIMFLMNQSIFTGALLVLSFIKLAIASTINVPADASLIVTDKTTSFYLLENQSIGAIASTANDLVVNCSWEEISS